MPDNDEKRPFSMATGEIKTEATPVVEKKADDTPAVTETPVVTKAEAADAGTTVDAVKAFFDSELAEKYGIKSKDELFGILEAVDKIKEENTSLKGRPTEPVFANDKQKNIYNFLQEYESLGEGMETVARLNNIIPQDMTPDQVLRETFILENKDLTREQAARVFDKREIKKYENPKKKEDYEDPQEFEDDNEMLKIQKDRDVAKGRRTLTENKEKLKIEAKSKREVALKDDAPAVPPQAVARYTKEIDGFFKDFNALTYSEDDGSNEVTIKLSDKQLIDLKEAAYAHVKNPSLYKDGEIENFNLVNLVDTFAWALNHRDMASLMLKQTKTNAQILKADEIAQKQPEKKSGTNEGAAVAKNGWEKMEQDAAKRAEERKANPAKRTPLPAGN